MRALIIRERMEDNYDPDPKFGWIVELDWAELDWAELGTSGFDWMKTNFGQGNYFLLGRVIGFVNRDDALMFYLKYA